MEPSQRSIRTEGNPDHGCDWAERAFVNATQPTSTDHLVDVLARLRDGIDEWVLVDIIDDATADALDGLADADAILKTYGK